MNFKIGDIVRVTNVPWNEGIAGWVGIVLGIDSRNHVIVKMNKLSTHDRYFFLKGKGLELANAKKELI